jgi:hypothetical protein
VKIHIVFFWVVTHYSLVVIYQSFEGTYSAVFWKGRDIRCGVFWGIMQCGSFPDVLGRHIGPIFTGPEVQEKESEQENARFMTGRCWVVTVSKWAGCSQLAWNSVRERRVIKLMGFGSYKENGSWEVSECPVRAGKTDRYCDTVHSVWVQVVIRSIYPFTSFTLWS